MLGSIDNSSSLGSIISSYISASKSEYSREFGSLWKIIILSNDWWITKLRIAPDFPEDGGPTKIILETWGKNNKSLSGVGTFYWNSLSWFLNGMIRWGALKSLDLFELFIYIIILE